MNFKDAIKLDDGEKLFACSECQKYYIIPKATCNHYQQNIINQLKEELEKERSAVDDMAKMFNKCRDNNCNCVNDIAFYRQKERVNFE